MDPIQRGLVGLHILLMTFLLAGLWYRRLFRISYTFVAYGAAIVVLETLIRFRPEQFFVWGFYATKEITYGLLKLALLLEITILTYQSFPNARAMVGAVLATSLMTVAALMTIGMAWNAEFPDLVRDLLRRLALGTAFGYFATWTLVLWYRIPLHRWHRAILRGLVPYLVVFAAARNVMITFGWDVQKQVNVGENVCYAVVLAYWCWEVWRKPPDEPGFLRTLQPWRARL